MSGWYVEVILLNRESIKDISNLTETDLDSDTYSMKFEDDLYLDLLDIERAIVNMRENSLISDDELVIMNLFLNNNTISGMGKSISVSRWTASKIFRGICSRIAYFLGGHFTDDGYLDYIKEKYKLNDYQIDLLSKRMKSGYRLKGLNLG